jgi:type IV secretory pathway VirB4 component
MMIKATDEEWRMLENFIFLPLLKRYLTMTEKRNVSKRPLLYPCLFFLSHRM